MLNPRTIWVNVDANMSILPLDTPAPIVSANICHWTSEVRCERVVLCVETVFAIRARVLLSYVWSSTAAAKFFNDWSYPHIRKALSRIPRS